MAIAKREKAWKAKLLPGKQYPIDDALKMVKEFATAKFNETVDAAVNLGIDAAKSDQQVRGSTVMPHGTGKTLRVAVFTAGKNVELAKAAGADIVGMEDLAAQVKAGNINFDRVIASPDAMRVGKSKFEANQLKDNLLALINDLNKAKPATSKGIYLKKITLSSTMGPGVVIDQASLGL
jgi:large subunit ribosomal protein L1